MLGKVLGSVIATLLILGVASLIGMLARKRGFSERQGYALGGAAVALILITTFVFFVVTDGVQRSKREAEIADRLCAERRQVGVPQNGPGLMRLECRN